MAILSVFFFHFRSECPSPPLPPPGFGHMFVRDQVSEKRRKSSENELSFLSCAWFVTIGFFLLSPARARIDTFILCWFLSRATRPKSHSVCRSVTRSLLACEWPLLPLPNSIRPLPNSIRPLPSSSLPRHNRPCIRPC